jgi:putative inorganic carbon (hco3(-)) transporter
MKNIGLNLYLLFMVSWFLHWGLRVPVLGTVRFDLVLVLVLAALALAGKSDTGVRKTETAKMLTILVAYAILTIPFVQWPGSVINRGIPDFLKAIIFYYFTIAFIDNERDLKKFVGVFLACQAWRVLEPLYLHVTDGYWGEFASMADWEYLERLAGAPNDVINPNGLAFVICTLLPFLYFMGGLSWRTRIAAVALAPALLYALVLTGSRSGILALLVIFLGILVKSKRRVAVGSVGLLAVVVGFQFLSGDTQDRYLSIFGMGYKNKASAEFRTHGVEENFQIALRRPVFGHGLGTSAEANGAFGTNDKPAHNLYAEVAEELGFVGLIIVLLFIKSISSAFAQCKRANLNREAGPFIPRLIDAMQVWLWMNFLFSFASYGLSSYEWYLLGGFSVLLQRLAGGSSVKDGASSGHAGNKLYMRFGGAVHPRGNDAQARREEEIRGKLPLQ